MFDCFLGSLSLGLPNNVLRVLVPLECTCIPLFLQSFLNFSPMLGMYGITMEPIQQGSLPFLDTLVTIEQDNTFSTTVYRKPTHTDQYLHWDSNHHSTAKQSVFNTLAHRTKVVSSSQDKLDQGLLHIKTALQHCQFPKWALNQWLYKFTNPNQPANHNSTNNTNQQDSNPNKRNITIVVQ